MKLEALKNFKDKVDGKTRYKVGDTLETSDVDRINDLVARGICRIASLEEEKQPALVEVSGKEYPLAGVKEALGTIGVEVAANLGVKGTSKLVASLTEEMAEALAETLNGEE